MAQNARTANEYQESPAEKAAIRKGANAIADVASAISPSNEECARAVVYAIGYEDLLQALRDCMQEMPTTCHAWRQARAAIAKAEIAP